MYTHVYGVIVFFCRLPLETILEKLMSEWSILCVASCVVAMDSRLFIEFRQKGFSCAGNNLPLIIINDKEGWEGGMVIICIMIRSFAVEIYIINSPLSWLYVEIISCTWY